MKYKFRSHYVNRPVAKKEKNNGERLVDATGYRTAEQQIKDMINAGQRLVGGRAEQYDGPDGSEPAINPLRRPGVDMVEVEAQIKKSAALIKAYKAARAAAKTPRAAPAPATTVPVAPVAKKPDEDPVLPGV